MKEAKKISPVTSDDIIDLVLSENQIEEYNISHEELFYLKFTGKILGPVWAKNLNDFLDMHEHQLDEDAQVRTFDGTTWSSLFEHPRFTRRRPQVLSHTQIDSNKQVLLLDHGVVKGPYPLSKIKKRIQKDEVLLTDMISTDDGRSWKKIYKFDIFNRREDNSASPPVTPQDAIISDDEAISNFRPDDSGLYNLYSSKPVAKEIKGPQVKIIKKSTGPLVSKKAVYIVLGVIFSIISIILVSDFLSTPDIEVDDVTEVKTKSVKKIKAKTKNKIRVRTPSTVNKTIRPARSKIRRKKSYSRAIFKKEKVSGEQQSSWVKSIATKDREYIIEDEEENDSTPYEQDPIRSRLSRKSLEDEPPVDYGENDLEDTVQENEAETRDIFLEKLQRAAEESNMDYGEDDN